MRSTAHQFLETARIAPRVRKGCAVMGERVKIPMCSKLLRKLASSFSESLLHANIPQPTKGGNMFNATYGAGFRAGKSDPEIKLNLDGTKHLEWTPCPFPERKFIKQVLWEAGFHEGMMQRMAQPQPRRI